MRRTGLTAAFFLCFVVAASADVHRWLGRLYLGVALAIGGTAVTGWPPPVAADDVAGAPIQAMLIGRYVS